jgi:hypothetical protein
MKRAWSFGCSKSPQKVMHKSVELKALTQLEDVHLAQAMNYLEAYNVEIGLLINFGAKSLHFKRLHNNKLLKSSQWIKLKDSLMHDALNLQDSHSQNSGKLPETRNKESC